MDRRDDNFRNGIFSWFTGEVLKVHSDGTNRVKVFPHGYYDEKFNSTEDKIADSLPWATVMMPCTTPGIKDASMNHSLEVGSHVVGFFRDGPSAQDPIIMGVITGQDVPNDASKTNKVETTVAGVKTEIDQNTGNITIGAGILGKFKIF